MKMTSESSDILHRWIRRVVGCFFCITVLPACMFAQINYTPYTFITFAGSPGIKGTNNGVGGGARFNGPGGVAVDVSNTVYLADQNNNLIRKITAGGVASTIAGISNNPAFQDGTNTHALFNQPSGVAVDGAGNLIVADLGNNAIRTIRPAGTNWVSSTIVYGAGEADGTNRAARLTRPHDVTVDGAGNIFFVEGTPSATVRRISPMGTNWIVTTIAGKAGVPGIADGTNSDALFFDPETVTIGLSGNVFVGDDRAIRELSPVGTNWVVTTIAGAVTNLDPVVDGTNTAARFLTVRGLEMNPANGCLYVADLGGLVRKVTPAGTNWVVTTLAGRPGIYGASDGAGALASFFACSSVAVDGFGNLYVADFGNSIIRKGFPFAITNQPQGTGEAIGTTANFGVALFGSGPFSCQWLFNAAPLAGQTNAMLTLDSVQRTNSGQYAVTITGPDTNDIVVSSNAELRVLATPVLLPPQVAAAGVWRIRFQDVDGGVPFDLNSLELQWRTNLPSGADTNWQSLTTGFYYTNSFVEIDQTNLAGNLDFFYRVVEH
jgi:hypothetical protein